jgi:hypothetical protein
LAGGPTALRWQFIDADGNVTAEGVLEVATSRSLYDCIYQPDAEGHVSDPESYYFAVPPQVHLVRLQALDAPLLVAGFTRPPALPRVVHVPEDYHAFSREDQLRRSWFGVNPWDHERLIADQRSVTLILQPRPPTDDAQLLAGCYHWEDYHPRGLWTARHVLTPIEAQATRSDAALRTTYAEMTTEDDLLVRLVAEPGRRWIAPSLIYASGVGRPAPLRVYVDGRLHFETTVSGTSGEVLLPPLLNASSHENRRLRFATGAPMRLFMNSVEAPDRAGFLKRLALRFDKAELEFEYEKTIRDDETLMFRFFRGPRDENRVRLRVQIAGAEPRDPGPYRSRTLRDRVYDLRAHREEGVLVIGGGGEQVDGGQVCFLPLGSDLPTGKYAICVRREEGRGGYLILSKTTPGRVDADRIFSEMTVGD